jgi:hypothetical protein
MYLLQNNIQHLFYRVLELKTVFYSSYYVLQVDIEEAHDAWAECNTAQHLVLSTLLAYLPSDHSTDGSHPSVPFPFPATPSCSCPADLDLRISPALIATPNRPIPSRANQPCC